MDKICKLEQYMQNLGKICKIQAKYPKSVRSKYAKYAKFDQNYMMNWDSVLCKIWANYADSGNIRKIHTVYAIFRQNVLNYVLVFAYIKTSP